MNKKACIYHFSANPSSKVCRDHIIEITEYANSDGYVIDEIYVDDSLMQTEKLQHTKMLQEAGMYNSLFVRDLFHINKWVVKCMSYISYLQQNGTTVFSMKSGKIHFDVNSSELQKPYKALFYHSKVSMADERKYETQKDIVKVFCKEKTNWTVVESIYEESDKKSVHEQPKLWALGDISSKYDLVIVQSFSRLDLRTARFEKIVKQLNVKVYSLQEGLLEFRKER